MFTSYCIRCDRKTGFGRKYGIGTLIMVILTAGFWILLMPFYPRRCQMCGDRYHRIRSKTAPIKKARDRKRLLKELRELDGRE